MTAYLDNLVSGPSTIQMFNELELIREASKPKGKIGKPGSMNRRIIHVEVKGDRRWELHATKGWRSRKA